MDTETEKYAQIVGEHDDMGFVGGLLKEGAVVFMRASQIKAYHKDLSKTEIKRSLSTFTVFKRSSLGAYRCTILSQTEQFLN
jgi:hypothetical protein